MKGNKARDWAKGEYFTGVYRIFND